MICFHYLSIEYMINIIIYFITIFAEYMGIVINLYVDKKVKGIYKE